MRSYRPFFPDKKPLHRIRNREFQQQKQAIFEQESALANQKSMDRVCSQFCSGMFLIIVDRNVSLGDIETGRESHNDDRANRGAEAQGTSPLCW